MCFEDLKYINALCEPSAKFFIKPGATHRIDWVYNPLYYSGKYMHHLI